MSYYDHATAIAFRIDIWAEKQPLKNYEQEAEIAVKQSNRRVTLAVSSKIRILEMIKAAISRESDPAPKT